MVEWRGAGGKNSSEAQEDWGVTDMFIFLILVMVSWAYTYTKMCHLVHLNRYHLLHFNFNFKKLFIKIMLFCFNP